MNEEQAGPMRTGAQCLVDQLAARGVRRIFGVPGGDCSLDIIEAAAQAGIAFVLARTENAAAMMASVTAELSGGLGVLLTTRGPGLAQAANGVACAMLDRSALLVISDGYENEQAFVSHQRFDQGAMLAPVTKGALRMDAPTAIGSVGALLDLALQDPPGPVYLEVTGKGVRSQVPAAAVSVRPAVVQAPAPSDAALATARGLMQAARRPVILAGLQAAQAQAAAALRELAGTWRCPVLSTYKGKGAVSDLDALSVGHFMAGGAEDDAMRSADLVLLFGADPIEFLPKPWSYPAQVVQVSTRSFARDYVVPAASVIGDLARAADGLRQGLPACTGWPVDEVAALKAHMRARARVPAEGEAITPNQLVDAVCRALPDNARIAVDAGAHMLPVMACFEARRPRDALISRGLATMAYALPAAIGAALEQPDRPVVAFTGDGGLMMCAAELATAVQAGCKLTVIVFNDSSIALIGVKQHHRKMRREGMDYSSTDFARVAQGFGCEGIRVDRADELAAAIDRALASPQPAVVDVCIDHAPYAALVKSLRG